MIIHITEILLIDTPCENIRNKISEIENTGYKFIKHKKNNYYYF